MRLPPKIMRETKKLKSLLEDIEARLDNKGFSLIEIERLFAAFRKAIEQRDEHRSSSRANEQIDAIERDDEQLRKILDGEEGGGK